MIPLNSSDVVQRTTDCVYHATCFSCLFCGQLLQPGDQFVINDGQLVCRGDYEAIMQNPFNTGEPACGGMDVVWSGSKEHWDQCEALECGFRAL